MYRLLLSAVASVVLAGILLGSGLLSETAAQQSSQQGKADRGKPQQPSQSTVQRTETTTFDAWRVTCVEVEGSKRRNCSAVLNALDQNRRPVMAWVIGRNAEGAIVTVLQTPQTTLGLNIQKGVELKLGNGAVRKLAYQVCDQNRCESVIQMDDAMIKEINSAASVAANAVVTIYRRDGQPITFTLPSINGADKALAVIGRG